MAELDPKSLRVAVALADTGSATRAARALHISQPGVSYHLRKLERALGATLFARGASGLVPTAAGDMLVQGSRSVLEGLERLVVDVRGVATGRGRAVRVSSACFTNYHWLPGVLTEFRRRWGEVHVALDVDPTRRPFEALDRGALDLALTTVPPEGAAYRVRPLFDDEVVAIVHPDSPLAERERVEPEDFRDQSVAVFDRSRSDLFQLALAPAGVTPREVTDVPVTEVLLELVRAGVAVSAMASWVAQPDLRLGRVRAVRIGRTGLSRTWCAVLSARRPTPAPVEAFVELLVERCAADPPPYGPPSAPPVS